MIARKLSPGALNTGTVRGLLDLGGGSLTTKHLSMAEQGAAGTAIAELKIHGTGEVEVSEGGILMGSNGATTSTISVTENGRLTVAGDIAKGAGTTNATLKVDGGTLELNRHSIRVDTFEAISGTLRNIGEVNSGMAWAKSGAGTLMLEGTNSYLGHLEVSAGMLLLAGSASQANLTVKNGASFSMTEDGVLQFNITSSASDLFVVEAGGAALFNGAFVINLDRPLEAGSWNLLTGTTQTNYSGLNDIALVGALAGNLVDQGSGLWMFQNSEWQASFNAINGDLSLQAIPEPSTFALLSLSLAAFFYKRRRA